jgi:hypothetical protein
MREKFQDFWIKNELKMNYGSWMINWCKHEQNGVAIGQHKSTQWQTSNFCQLK